MNLDFVCSQHATLCKYQCAEQTCRETRDPEKKGGGAIVDIETRTNRKRREGTMLLQHNSPALVTGPIRMPRKQPAAALFLLLPVLRVWVDLAGREETVVQTTNRSDLERQKPKHLTFDDLFDVALVELKHATDNARVLLCSHLH